MKKSIFAILFCITACFVGHSVFAIDVGGKSPTKTEYSVAKDNVMATAEAIVFENLSAVDFGAESLCIVKEANMKEVIDVPAVSMPEGDAAIPIHAQARYSYSNYSKLSLPTSIYIHNFSVDRYWC